MPEETTKNEILEAINDFANPTEKRFDKLETEVYTIKNTMATKSYLDDKLADLRGNLVVMLRKEDTKVKTLINVLET